MTTTRNATILLVTAVVLAFIGGVGVTRAMTSSTTPELPATVEPRPDMVAAITTDNDIVFIDPHEVAAVVDTKAKERSAIVHLTDGTTVEIKSGASSLVRTLGRYED